VHRPTTAPLVDAHFDPGCRSGIEVLGVHLDAIDANEAVGVMQSAVVGSARQTTRVYFANAHTLNLASARKSYRDALNRADLVLNDGIGVELAARLQGRRFPENLCGTDLVPELLSRLDRLGAWRVYLVGGTPDKARRAAERIAGAYPHLRLVGHSHGYLDREASNAVIARVNESGAELLLVAMGNPKQELWIDECANRLHAKLAVGIGGLIEYWAGGLQRAPAWIRKSRVEWAYILCRQPWKWRRYVMGNPAFVLRIIGERLRHLASSPEVRHEKVRSHHHHG
jgi:N-acetylglucosaminyldiphosphoundecaprenol N-acetyl-beta-D-mannosaminyltransferase